MAKKKGEFFYRDKDGNKQDGELHADMMEGADHEAALEVTRQRARKRGWDEETIARLYGKGK